MKVRTKSHKMHHQEGGGEIIGHKKHPVNCDCYLTDHALDQHAFVMNPRFAKQKKNKTATNGQIYSHTY